ncbi:Endonuclease V [Candidatus Lokiarchaeum ossiferum]|uniref:Endonuclease V n=1 Tax=Candidatus Lokiarchaeum ossiferum TaxID=2951803 RepID=A0ABY6HVI0_9ARCH|nr:Endonuclease V [Candidatus Lokiarchaeum sp. B-35]
METSWCDSSQKHHILKHDLMRTDLTEKEALSLQNKWRIFYQNANQKKLQIEDLDALRYVAGVDISFPPDKHPTWGIACVTLWDLQEGKLIEATFHQENLLFPYIPGFLGFRECLPIAQAILKLHRKPQIIICDGHGLIHPLQFGEAIQLGVVFDIPTFGAAKTPFVGTSSWKELTRQRGEKTPVYENELDPNREENKILGYAICAANERKPIFISEGYRVDIELAIRLTLKSTSDHRQPDPVFQADQLSREKIRTILNS